MPHRIEAADVQRLHARMLLARGERDYRDGARQMLSGAIDAYSMIGMPSHREIAESMMDVTV